jgi:hypothetical protein
VRAGLQRPALARCGQHTHRHTLGNLTHLRDRLLELIRLRAALLHDLLARRKHFGGDLLLWATASESVVGRRRRVARLPRQRVAPGLLRRTTLLPEASSLAAAQMGGPPSP